MVSPLLSIQIVSVPLLCIVPFLMVDLMNNSLILAKKNGADVFNCLDLMENNKVFKKLKFGPGDGMLQYYLYNWKAPHIQCPKVGLVLL